ncbi:MAG: O-antigen ligase family protein [Nitrosomonadales bacterium]|nr:O-antigen ligase family protein [Nitrosomonadales bacterium]
MPEHLRSLVYILILASLFFAFSQRFACVISNKSDFARRRNLWFGLTLAAFLAHSFWIYVVVTIPLLLFSNRHEPNPPALFFSVLLVLPMAIVQIPGMGLINYIFDLSHARLLSLFILLPAFFSLLTRSDTARFGRSGSDKALAAYLLLMVVLFFREANLTSTMRQIFYIFIDVFLPYFVVSRSLRSMQDFRDALLSLVLAIMVLAPLAVFESYKSWLLYSSLTEVLGVEEGMTKYLARDGLLRVIVTAGQPIVLGYLMAVGMGLYLFLQHSIKQNGVRRLGFALLTAGLIAPVSRGPWIGAAIMFIVFIATGPFALRRLASLALAAMIALPLVAMLPGGERVINLLPFIGTTEKGGIDYREQLITNSLIVIQRNPWFGSDDFLNTPEMEAMRQGEGIIDIVNHYIGITLKTGVVGLGLFVAFFGITLLGIYRAMRSIPDRTSEERLLGRVLLATLLAILTIIFTVSSIAYIPIVYWCVAGIGVAYAQMMRKRANDLPSSNPQFKTGDPLQYP